MVYYGILNAGDTMHGCERYRMNMCTLVCLMQQWQMWTFIGNI